MNKRRIGLFVSIFLVPALSLPSVAFAEGGTALEISPPVRELEANPGQTITAVVKLRNMNEGPVNVSSDVGDFVSADESGKAKILSGEDPSSRYSLRSWVDPLAELSFAGKEQKLINVTMHVPANAEPGGHYGVVLFSSRPAEVQGSGVALTGQIGELILLKVSGKIKHVVKLAEFYSAGHGARRGWFEDGPIDFVVRLKNEGSVHEKPAGTIEITDGLGGKLASIKVNEKAGNVLPDGIRKFDQSLAGKSLFGHYTARLNLSYADGQKIQGALGFWVVPWKSVGLVFLALVVLGYIVIRGLKRYNRYIISKSKK